MQVERVRVIIGDPNAAQRRPDKQDRIVRVVLTKSKRALASESGKALLRKRGEHLDRLPKLIAETQIKDWYDCLKHFIVTNRSSPPAS